MKPPYIDRSCLICSGPEAFLNLHVTPMIHEQPQCSLNEAMRKNMFYTPSISTANVPAAREYESKDSLPGYDRYMMNITRFHYCYGVAIDENHSEIDDFVLSLANHCRYNGVGQEFSVKRLMMYSEYHDFEDLVRRCFRNVYCQPTNRTEQNGPQMTVEMRRMMEFLGRRY